MINVAPELEELLEQTRQTILDFPGTVESFPWGTRSFSRDDKGKYFLFIYPQPGHIEIVFKQLKREKEAALKLPFIDYHKSMGNRGWLSAKVSQQEELDKVLPLLHQSYQLAKPLRGPADALPGEDTTVLELLDKVRQIAHRYDDVEEFFPYGDRAFRQRKGQIFLYATESDDWLTVMVRLPFGERELALTLPNVEIPKYIGHKGWVAVKVHNDEDMDMVQPWIELSFNENRPKRKARLKK